MGESVTEGTIARWVKAVGDPVKEGETVVEVTTDKVDVEVPSTATGRLAEIIAAEGATVEVGGTLATVAIDGALNAALLVVQMLAISDAGLAQKLADHRRQQAAK